MLRTYYNNKTGNSASIDVSADIEKREIEIIVSVTDTQAHSYDVKTFNPNDFGKAIDLYEATVKKFEAQQPQ